MNLILLVSSRKCDADDMVHAGEDLYGRESPCVCLSLPTRLAIRSMRGLAHFQSVYVPFNPGRF